MKSYLTKLYLLCYGVVPSLSAIAIMFLLSFLSPLFIAFDAIKDTVIGIVLIIIVIIAIPVLILSLFIKSILFKEESYIPDGMVARYLPLLLPIVFNLSLWISIFYFVDSSYVKGPLLLSLMYTNLGFLPISLIMAMSGNVLTLFLIIIGYFVLFLIIFTIFERKSKDKSVPSKWFIIISAVIILSLGVVAGVGIIEKQERLLKPLDINRRGYGTSYGGGYSSIDLAPYDVTNDINILAKLDKDSSFTINDKDKMAVIDGAEAAYPVYNAFANACYVEIAKNSELASDKVRFTNTIEAYKHLLNGEVDIFFGAEPSKAQRAMAKERGAELILTPIAKEAFVFVVSKDNKLDNITEEEIKLIYSGKIKNWKRITGVDERIYAFQRPEGSGSQTLLQKIMGETPIIKPLKEEYQRFMQGTVDKVADYRDMPGAIGYSFRYYVTKMVSDSMTEETPNIKLLNINGAEPTKENIASGKYPYTTDLYAITLKSNDLDTLKPFLAWMQGPEGQKLIEDTGYIPLK